MKRHVWECKIVVDGDLPDGFDFPPRRAAIEAVEAHGVEVLGCFSGWGGALTEGEKAWIERRAPDTLTRIRDELWALIGRGDLTFSLRRDLTDLHDRLTALDSLNEE